MADLVIDAQLCPTLKGGSYHTILKSYDTVYLSKYRRQYDYVTTWKRFSHYCPHGPLARYAKLRVVHTPGMPGTFSPRPRVSDPDMHHGTCVTHVPWCMLGSLTSGFPLKSMAGKRSRHSRRMRNPQFYVSGKRPMVVRAQSCRAWMLTLLWVLISCSSNSRFAGDMRWYEAHLTSP